MTGWGVYDLREECMEVHVIPEGDDEDHECSKDCLCEPDYEVFENGNVLYKHKAFDFREVREAIERGDLIGDR